MFLCVQRIDYVGIAAVAHAAIAAIKFSAQLQHQWHFRLRRLSGKRGLFEARRCSWLRLRLPQATTYLPGGLRKSLLALVCRALRGPSSPSGRSLQQEGSTTQGILLLTAIAGCRKETHNRFCWMERECEKQKAWACCTASE